MIRRVFSLAIALTAGNRYDVPQFIALFAAFSSVLAVQLGLLQLACGPICHPIRARPQSGGAWSRDGQVAAVCRFAA
jgi:hypothetical protein